MDNELNYLPKYRNMAWWRHTEMYNDLQKKMEHEYCRWYGSAWGLRSCDVEKLKEDIPGVDIMISMIGPVIGAHSGPGTLAVFVLGTDASGRLEAE